MEPRIITGLPDNLTALAAVIHTDNIRAGWWKQHVEQDEGGCTVAITTIPRNVGELLCLVHSEISEAYVQPDMMDDKLPHRRMREVELADASIRVLDMLGFYQFDINFLRGSGDRWYMPLPGADWTAWIAQMHSITSAAMERFRKKDEQGGCEKLVRLLGLIHFAAVAWEFDLTGAIAEKRAFNATRADHKLENRQAEGGKQF